MNTNFLRALAGGLGGFAKGAYKGLSDRDDERFRQEELHSKNDLQRWITQIEDAQKQRGLDIEQQRAQEAANEFVQTLHQRTDLANLEDRRIRDVSRMEDDTRRYGYDTNKEINSWDYIRLKPSEQLRADTDVRVANINAASRNYGYDQSTLRFGMRAASAAQYRIIQMANKAADEEADRYKAMNLDKFGLPDQKQAATDEMERRRKRALNDNLRQGGLEIRDDGRTYDIQTGEVINPMMPTYPNNFQVPADLRSRPPAGAVAPPSGPPNKPGGFRPQGGGAPAPTPGTGFNRNRGRRP